MNVVCTYCKEYIEYCRCAAIRRDPMIKVNAQGVTLKWVEERLNILERKIDILTTLVESLKESNKLEL